MEDKILNNRKLNWRGIWVVEYRGYNYTDVLYKTLPHRYINWETLDTFLGTDKFHAFARLAQW